MNKRGQTVLDVLLLLVVLIIVGIGFVAGMNAFDDIRDDIMNDDDMSATAKTEVDNTVSSFPVWADNMVAALVVFFWILLLVSSFLIDTNPVFFVVTFILLLFVFVVAMIMANTYADFIDTPDYTDDANLFPKLTWIMENLLIVTIVIALSTGVALYAKSRT